MQIAAAPGFRRGLRVRLLVLMALCLRFASERTRILDSLSANAYSMYLLHYVFIVWLQYALLPVGLFAIGKAAIVFGGTLVLSWAAAVAFDNVSWANHLAQARRWVGPSFSELASAELAKQDEICPDDVPRSNAAPDDLEDRLRRHAPSIHARIP